MNKKNYFFTLIFLTAFSFGQNQNIQQKFIQKIYEVTLDNGKSYNWLGHLSNQIGGRLSGSLNAERAIQWSKEELNLLNIDLRLQNPWPLKLCQYFLVVDLKRKQKH